MWYGLASLLSFSSFVLIIVALAVPHWLSGKILCQTGVDLVNATDLELVKFIGDIYYGLFRGCKVRQCGLGGRQSQFTSEYVWGMGDAYEHSYFFSNLEGCLCLSVEFAVCLTVRHNDRVHTNPGVLAQHQEEPSYSPV